MRAGPPGISIVYEDNHVLVVDKPAGLLSQRDETGDDSILEHVSRWLKVEEQKPGNVYLGLVHRLDRPVSGLLVLARTSKAAARLSSAVRERRFEKRYRALVVGTAPPGAHRLEGMVDGKTAALTVTAVERRGGLTLVEIDLETGRKHQIRIQLSDAGFPIVGDVRFGGPRWHDPGAIALQAFGLCFPHPTRSDPIRLEIPEPRHWQP